MTFSLWDAQAGGSRVWWEGPKSVPVYDGLFNVVLGDTTALSVNQFDQELWLEIDVKGVTLPRQKLMGAPYAFSLAPGAQVSGSIAGDYVLEVRNWGDGPALFGGSLTQSGIRGESHYGYGVEGISPMSGYGVRGTSDSGHGVYAESDGSGLSGSAIYAKNTNTEGVALWAHNEYIYNSDTTLALTNDGTGMLIKGFGGDDTTFDFAVNNDGTIETKAESSVFIPGTALETMEYNKPRWEKLRNGSVFVYGGGDTLERVYIPISIPAMLYGQNVKLKEVTIFYRCENGSHNYIRATGLYSPSNTGPDYEKIFYEDSMIRNAESVDFYTFEVNQTLEPYWFSPADILNLSIEFNFANTTQWVQIDGVRLTLGHHSLY
jgi:hypothetical protein